MDNHHLANRWERMNVKTQRAFLGRYSLFFLLAVVLCLLVFPVCAQQSNFPAFTSTPIQNGGTAYTLSIQTLLLFTTLTFLPALILMMSSFTRIIIVLSLLRLALGTQSSPPNQVLIGLTLFLTLFVMSPVIDRIYQEAYLPFSQDKINIFEAGEKASVL